ncbi:MAG: glycoside hydrolase family 3 C-terminal domain-containing protein, partial [Lachnospiraceae bacterium]|nr:glycoside hydrolase family 3 C-terminal domain-containing protein [Lachnospiraceae bacterium]
TDTAVISISRFSGEGWDRKSSFDAGKVQKELGDLTGESARIFEKGDFYLTNAEQKMVDDVSAAFEKVSVVLNVGGIVDTSWFSKNDRIQGVLLAFQGGMEGGLAAATLLCGLNTPSGKLSDTYAARLEDYPYSETFHASNDYVDYTEDIYVGYRYFETIPGKAEKVVYPFGYGLSYTTFRISDVTITQDGDSFRVTANVCNTGKMPGKEVVQVYCEKPQGRLGKPARELVAFAKTGMLYPGQSQLLGMHFEKYQLSSYDDLGKVTKSAYVLEAGDYFFHVGTSVRDTEKNAFVYSVDRDTVLVQLSEKMKPTQLKARMLSDGSLETLETGTPNDPRANALTPLTEAEYEGFTPDQSFKTGQHMWGPGIEHVHTLEDVAEGTVSMDDFLAQLTDRDLADLLGGQPNTGVADTFGFGNLPLYGIPNIMTEDGPAGLRIRPDRGVCTTAWPCATLLASTWDPAIIEQVGLHAGLEVKENNIGFWLTPAINIHRSPLCGRNFEYYSEDPYLAGKLASAMVRGIQSNRVGVSVKHFALNNKETNRKQSDSRASERAIREIYLKAFELIVKEADPWTIMSSYNIINGHRASENKEMLTDILRGEWGFKGIVTTDWWTAGEHYKELLAGNDIKMGRGYPDRLMQALEIGQITRDDMIVSVTRLLDVLLRFE